jgi:hypothetical protein
MTITASTVTPIAVQRDMNSQETAVLYADAWSRTEESCRNGGRDGGVLIGSGSFRYRELLKV